tara:strand:- start:2592 stop:2921 length:330 start_codon:yes stop_codon:yes gene_type:complete
MLSADSNATLGNRAKNLADSAVLEVESFIGNLRKEKLQLNTKLNDLTDLAPENTYDLRPGGKDFDAGRWVAELHRVRMDLALKEVQLAEAQAIYDEWFAEDVAPAKKAK